jgi:hypothetical protein
VSNDEELGFPIKTREAGEVPATFSFRFTEDALYVTGTSPIGEDQALIIADVLGECFGAQMLEAAAAFAVEQEAGKPPQHSLRLWSRCMMTRSPAAKTHRSADPAGALSGFAVCRPAGQRSARRSHARSAVRLSPAGPAVPTGEDLLLHSRTRTISSGASWYPAR